jgi:hypothetical protein
VLAPVVVRDQVHRARSEQRVGGDQVLEPVGLHLDQQPAHAARFELEHAGRVAPLEELEDLLVVVRGDEPLQIERVLAPDSEP